VPVADRTNLERTDEGDRPDASQGPQNRAWPVTGASADRRDRLARLGDCRLELTPARQGGYGERGGLGASWDRPRAVVAQLTDQAIRDADGERDLPLGPSGARAGVAVARDRRLVRPIRYSLI
jgi:hypothetical protein